MWVTAILAVLFLAIGSEFEGLRENLVAEVLGIALGTTSTVLVVDRARKRQEARAIREEITNRVFETTSLCLSTLVDMHGLPGSLSVQRIVGVIGHDKNRLHELEHLERGSGGNLQVRAGRPLTRSDCLRECSRPPSPRNRCCR